eukprot:284819080_6
MTDLCCERRSCHLWQTCASPHSAPCRELAQKVCKAGAKLPCSHSEYVPVRVLYYSATQVSPSRFPKLPYQRGAPEITSGQNDARDGSRESLHGVFFIERCDAKIACFSNHHSAFVQNFPKCLPCHVPNHYRTLYCHPERSPQSSRHERLALFSLRTSSDIPRRHHLRFRASRHPPSRPHICEAAFGYVSSEKARCRATNSRKGHISNTHPSRRRHASTSQQRHG